MGVEYMSNEDDKIEIGVKTPIVAGKINVSGLSKTIKATEEFVGSIMRPLEKYLGAKAEASALITTAKAEVEAAKITLTGHIELKKISERAQDRSGKELIRKQINRELITLNAMKEIPENVSDDPVDSDWLASFYSISEDVSNTEMQSLWGKILAGEISKPGSFSLRALQLVKTLKKDEAHLFTKFCTYVWHEKKPDGAIKEAYHIRLTPSSEFKDDYLLKSGISFENGLHLDHIGLIRFDFAKGVTLTGKDKIGYHHNEHVFDHPNQMAFSVFLLTSLGLELLPICGAQSDANYEKRILELFTTSGAKVE